LAQAGAHLSRRTIGKGQREYSIRCIGAGGDPIRYPVGDGTGLPGSRSGEHTDRPTKFFGHNSLVLVESREQFFRGCSA
jgi:hypothetical protein